MFPETLSRKELEMKTKHLQLLFVIALALPFFTACKKDTEYVAPSNTELLAAHEWKGDQVLMMGMNILETGGAQQGIPDFRTVRLTFHRDNTYVAVNDEGTTFNGEWRFNDDETKIHFDFLGFEEFDVKKLTDEDLHLSTRISISQLTLLAQVLQVNTEIINSLPYITEVETEIRFVKL